MLGPDFVIATSFWEVMVVVIEDALLVAELSAEEPSVVEITAELIKEPAGVAGRIAATICSVFRLAPEARFPTLKIKSSGLDGFVSDADGGIVMLVPLSVALTTRIPSGILSVTRTPIASEGPLFTAVSV